MGGFGFRGDPKMSILSEDVVEDLITDLICSLFRKRGTKLVSRMLFPKT